ncbi:MAG: ferrochelatase, partial [bacterium]
MSAEDRTTAVLLLNMGGPDSLDAVRPFLTNLFSDPAIIGLPGFLRLPLARLMGKRRAEKVTPRYRLIGGRSPISQITAGQAQALASVLRDRGHDIAGVFPAFSYWHPFIHEAVDSAHRAGARRLIALSLYPQYCRATTGTCVQDLSRALPGTPFEARTRIVDSWPDHPGYIG